MTRLWEGRIQIVLIRKEVGVRAEGARESRGALREGLWQDEEKKRKSRFRQRWGWACVGSGREGGS